MLYTVSRKRNGYARNNICTLYLIIRPHCLQKLLRLVDECRRYGKPSSVVFETRYTAWLKRHNFRGLCSCFPASAVTLVRRGGITNHHLIAYCLSNISAKNYQNQLMCVEVIVRNIIVVFLRHSVDIQNF